MAHTLRFLAECLFTFYSVTFLLYHKNTFPVRQGYWIYFMIAAFINWSFGAVWGLSLSSHYGALALLGIIILELKLMYKMNPIQILFESSYFAALLYWGRGIVLPAFALCLEKSVQWVRHDEFYYPIAWFISICIILVYNGFFRHVIAPQSQMEKFYRSKEQVRFVAIFQTGLLAYLLFVNLGRYYGVDLQWYKITYIVSCVICFASQSLLTKRGIRMSTLLEFELHNQFLQKQLRIQLRHYNAYQKYTESFRAFKHDYKNMMASVKSLLSAGEYQKAERMLDTIHDTMQKQVLVHKTYSNQIILDAILQDVANMCEEQETLFSAMVYIPKALNISDINGIRIFSNLTNNAVEACAKVTPESERFITITSGINTSNDWLKVEISNSFNGELNVRNGIPESTKANKDFHGIGLTIVTEIIEHLGGVINIDADQEKKVFTVTLLLPLSK